MLLAELLAGPPTETTLTELLREVIDPELGVNIVDLGLLRAVDVAPDRAVHVVITLTTPACPLGPYITDEVHDVLAQVDGIGEVTVDVAWAPPWNADRDLTAHAKRLLGWYRRATPGHTDMTAQEKPI